MLSVAGLWVLDYQSHQVPAGWVTAPRGSPLCQWCVVPVKGKCIAIVPVERQFSGKVLGESQFSGKVLGESQFIRKVLGESQTFPVKGEFVGVLAGCVV